MVITITLIHCLPCDQWLLLVLAAYAVLVVELADVTVLLAAAVGSSVSVLGVLLDVEDAARL